MDNTYALFWVALGEQHSKSFKVWLEEDVHRKLAIVWNSLQQGVDKLKDGEDIRKFFRMRSVKE